MHSVGRFYTWWWNFLLMVSNQFHLQIPSVSEYSLLYMWWRKSVFTWQFYKYLHVHYDPFCSVMSHFVSWAEMSLSRVIESANTTLAADVTARCCQWWRGAARVTRRHFWLNEFKYCCSSQSSNDDARIAFYRRSCQEQGIPVTRDTRDPLTVTEGI